MIKILSLNIELNKHLKKIIKFISKKKPEVLLLQEVMKKDIVELKKNLGMDYCVFTPTNLMPYQGKMHTIGIATFSKYEFKFINIHYYRGSLKKIPITLESLPEQLARPIIITEITKYFHKYRLINIYFTWSPNAIVSKIQLEDFKKLQNILYQYSDFALCGDFNTPRGSIIFNKLSEQYKDNIPIEINSTIDQNLHIAKKLQIVVDGVFTTTRYTISDINVYNGLSDHCGILFNLSII